MKPRRVFILICAALVLSAPSALAQPPVWTVRSAHATLVLFGSVHLLPPGLDWAPQPLTEALAKANDVWFELPIDEATDGEAERLAQQAGRLPKGDNLYKHLSTAAATRLSDACERLKLPPRLLAPMRPWLAEVTLSLAQDARAGAMVADGVEEQLSAQAPKSVHRRAFETPQQQIDFLARAPLDAQIASLDQTVSEIADDPDLYGRVVKEWMAGDLGALQRDAIQPLAVAAPVLYQRLITDRNRRWAATLSRRLSGRGVIVVIVGTGHLLGREGLPALLRARGFAVEGPNLDNPVH